MKGQCLMKSIHNFLHAALLVLLASPCGAAVSPCAKIAVTPGAIPDASTSVAYSQRLTATGGASAAFGFAISSQGLPPGLSLTNATSTTIDITGTPTLVGNYLFTLTATTTSAPAGCSGGRSFQIKVNGSVSYTTNFDLTESPISEGGAWKHLGLDWTLINTSGGNAFGTQFPNNGYDDSYAHLSGFPANHTASGRIHKSANMDPGCTHEVEILLRWDDSAHNARGYECNLAWDGGYSEIVRWNGPVGDFTYLARGGVGGGVHDGDTLSASIVGNHITLSVNGSVVVEATDSTFATGNPGMAFWRGGGCGTIGDYGFTQYNATSLP
jgi:hypothetical protein